jgi:predicted TIM-barrel enzyme
MDAALERTQIIVDAVKKTNNETFFLAHGGPINTPSDVRYALDNVTGLHGFVGASSIERMGVEASLTNLTKEFKSLSITTK